jgi:L-rhamnose-H+ transport protein
MAATAKPQHATLQVASSEMDRDSVTHSSGVINLQVPILKNYLFAAIAGTTWYFQFFFYTMGETQMGKFAFSSWTLHMASIIIFSTMWGWILHEWKGSSNKAHTLIAAGIAVLILSTIVVGYGNFLGVSK